MYGFCGDTTPSVTVNDVYQQVSSRQDLVLLDVRTPQEYADAHIAESILLPDYEIQDKVEKAVPDKEKMIYVYCRTGGRSSRAVQQMRDMGYTNVFNVMGGITTWQAQNYPVEKLP